MQWTCSVCVSFSITTKRHETNNLTPSAAFGFFFGPGVPDFESRSCPCKVCFLLSPLRFTLGQRVHCIRKGKKMGEGKIRSIRRFKEEVRVPWQIRFCSFSWSVVVHTTRQAKNGTSLISQGQILPSEAHT